MLVAELRTDLKFKYWNKQNSRMVWVDFSSVFKEKQAVAVN